MQSLYSTTGLSTCKSVYIKRRLLDDGDWLRFEWAIELSIQFEEIELQMSALCLNMELLDNLTVYIYKISLQIIFLIYIYIYM